MHTTKIYIGKAIYRHPSIKHGQILDCLHSIRQNIGSYQLPNACTAWHTGYFLAFISLLLINNLLMTDQSLCLTWAGMSFYNLDEKIWTVQIWKEPLFRKINY